MSRPDDLATLIRAPPPRPSDEFLGRLDGRVAERFGRPERPRRAWPKWRIAGGLAAACAAGAIVVVAVSDGGGSDDAVPVNAAAGHTPLTQTVPASSSESARAG